jgi:ribokinase
MGRSTIFVSGLVNVESTLKINDFPINYSPVEYLFDGISSNVSGVGYNVSKALRTLGDEVHLHTIVGDDALGHVVNHELKRFDIGAEGVYHTLDATPQSIIIYDSTGRRKIYCDLKNIQDATYPIAFTHFYQIKYDLAILTNVNFSRGFFEIFKEKNIPIATDCHVLKDINSEYDKQFLENANIVFMSNEAIKGNEEAFMRQIIDTYNQDIIVIAMGDQGSMIYDRVEDQIHRVKAMTVRTIVNTIGAGDALFSAFLHFYIQGEEPLDSLVYATYFASYKIGANGGAEGFLTEEELFDKFRDETQ